MAQNARTILVATVMFFTIEITAQAQPMLITEIPNGSRIFATAGDFAYFGSSDSLFRTDGTSAGTTFLRSGFSSALSRFTEVNGMLFFTSGQQLWRSDGTPGGTIHLTTKNELGLLASIGITLFFQGSDAVTGRELYKTNGTSAGTVLVKDINPGPGDGFNSFPHDNSVVGQYLFFKGNNGTGAKLWKSDGTAAGTQIVHDVDPLDGSSYSRGGVYAHNNLFYFTGYTAANGKEPWVSDGSAAGTSMVKDIVAGAESPGMIHYCIGLNGSVYFITLPPTDEWETEGATASLWKTNGTAASTIELSALGDDVKTSFEDPFRIYDGKVYFFIRDALRPHVLWVTDGTPVGTHEIYNVLNYEGLYMMNYFEVVNDYMLFYGTADAAPTPFYRSDGTTDGTIEFTRFNSGGYLRHPRGLTEVDDFVFYADHDGPGYEGHADDPADYFHLFQTNGVTTASMKTMFGIPTIGTDNIANFNGKVVFTTQNTPYEKNLWIYDPATAPSEQVGKIQHEVWNGVTGTKVSSIPVNEEPSSVSDLTIFETPSDIGDNYGSRVRGYVLIPQTGNYTFWISSDDQSQLLLSSDENPANKVKIAEVTGWTDPRQWNKYPSQQSASRSLVAGRKYYIEALLKEGTGGDHLAVGWRMSDGALERPIPGNRLVMFNTSPVIVITDPSDAATFTAPVNITITADASDAHGSIVKVEFYNGTAKLGEDTSSPYSFSWNGVSAGSYDLIAKATDDDGGVHADTVQVTVNGGSACAGAGMIRQEFWTGVSGTTVSAIPVDTESDFVQDLTMFEGPVSSVGDNYGSRIRGYICPPASGPYVFWISGDDHVELSLSTNGDPVNKTRIAYHTGWTSKRQWTKYSTQHSVPITLQANQRYYIEALMKEGSGGDHVSVGWQLPDGSLQRPIAGAHVIPFGSEPPPPACSGTGTISVETWTGIDGARVSSIPVDTPPDLTGGRNIFEAPINVGNNFGSRFHGYLCVPATGNYTFWIASDDHSELWLSTDADPAKKRRIAYHTGWTSPRQWTKYVSQQSAPVSLVAGQQYYIEALYKEDEGGDNMAVGWQLPDATFERPIPGSRLSPFDDAASAMAARTAGKADLYSQINVYPNPAKSGDPQLTISGYEGIDEAVETQIQIINMRGEVVFADRISCGADCSSYLVNLNKQLVPGIYVVHIQTNAYRSSKRLLVK